MASLISMLNDALLISSWAQLNIKSQNLSQNLWRTLRVRHRFWLWLLIMPGYLLDSVTPSCHWESFKQKTLWLYG